MRLKYPNQKVFSIDQIDQRLRKGLIGLWIGQGVGKTLKDYSGYNNPGTFVGNTKWTFGLNQSRYAIGTAAGTDQVTCGNAALFANLGPLSIATWVNVSSFSAEQSVVQKLNSTATAGWGLYIDASTGKVGFFNIATSGVSALSTPALSLNQWTHVACTVTAQIAGTTTIYIDGQPVALGANTPASGSYPDDTAANLSLAGRDFDTAGVVGTLDYVGLWNRVLSASEIAMLAQPAYSPILAITN